MERREREIIVSPTEETIPLEEERSIPPPRFDEKSIQHAQPAVPLTLGKRVRTSSLPIVLLCVLGGVAGGLLGGLALTLYQRGGSDVTVESAHTRVDAGGATAGDVTAGETAQTGSDAVTAPQPQANAPAAGTEAGTVAAGVPVTAPNPQPPAVEGARTRDTRAGLEVASAPPPPAARDSASDVSDGPPDASTQGELRSALGEWVAATNARDVGRQMNFYAPTVDAFYLSRNASRAAVREEKARLFASAQSVNVEAAQPDIRLSRDGRTAVMRFRKRYQITGGNGSRSGEVLQELRWRRTGTGWKIVGERDLRVLQ